MIKRCLILIICLLLCACGLNEPPQAAAPVITAYLEDTRDDPVISYEPVYGGELVLSMRLPKTLNPILNADASVDRVLKLIFEPLFNIGADFSIIPNIALSFEPSSDRTGAYLTLRSDMFWSDGTPVTINDFIFTVNELKQAPEGVIYKNNVSSIISCDVIDNLTAFITFSDSLIGKQYLFTFPLIPARYYASETSPSSPRNMHPLGNGAFLFSTYKNGEDMLLLTAGQAYIESIRVKIIPDAQTDAYAFSQNITDVIQTNSAFWSNYRTGRTKALIHEYNTTMYEFLGFNFNNANLQNTALRKAIALCIDKTDIVTGAYYGGGVIANTPIHPDSWLSDPDTEGYAFDIAAAKDVIAEDNVKSDIALRLLVNAENEERVRAAHSIKNTLANIGINIYIETADFNAYKERLRAYDFDMFIGGFNLSLFPDMTFMLHSSQIISGSNFMSYNDPVLDALLMDIYAADDTTLLSAVSTAQKRVGAQVPVVGLVFRKSICLTSERVRGEIDMALNNIFANIRRWYIIDE